MNDQQPGNAWADAEERYQAGQKVRGTVTRIAQFGVFVQVEPGIEGVVYAFELGPGAGALASLAPGQEMELYVKSVDAKKKRLELGLEGSLMPGLLAEHALPPELRRKAQPSEVPWPLPHPQPETVTSSHPVQSAPGCPTCQRTIQATWKYCVYCGGSLQRRCSACGSVQPDLPDALYCYECGKPIA